jgi:hypothetical protein
VKIHKLVESQRELETGGATAQRHTQRSVTALTLPAQKEKTDVPKRRKTDRGHGTSVTFLFFLPKRPKPRRYCKVQYSLTL